jgi:hypothetical protein
MAVIDRRESAHHEIVMIFDLGIHRLLVLRDKLLVMEAEEMSSPSLERSSYPTTNRAGFPSLPSLNR